MMLCWDIKGFGWVYVYFMEFWYDEIRLGVDKFVELGENNEDVILDFFVNVFENCIFVIVVGGYDVDNVRKLRVLEDKVNILFLK